jgi:hypothetical protein
MILFKTFTGIVGIYHVLLGLSGLLLPHELFAKVAALILGVRSDMNTTFQLVAKFASVYVLVFGITALILMINPRKYRVLALPVLVLFGVRLINKTVFYDRIAEVFNVSTAQNIFALGCLVVFFFGILLTLPTKQES